MKRAFVSIIPLLIAVPLFVFYLSQGNAEAKLPDSNVQACTLPYDMACYLRGGARVDSDVVKVHVEIDATEAKAVAKLLRLPENEVSHQIVLLGKAELFDKNLSVNKDTSCAICHMPETGYTNNVALFNKTTVALSGSEPITNVGFHGGHTYGMPHPDYRVGNRKPQSYGYAAFMQVLAYDASAGNFTGGNFWDMRATGMRLGNPAAEQAEGPPLNPVEMGMADRGCVVYRLAQSKYAGPFKTIFGANVFAINFPSNVESVCRTPGGGPNAPTLQFSPTDQERVGVAYDDFAQAIAAYEASAEVSAFTSKFDYVLKHQATFTPSEERGFKLFNGRANCEFCHSDTVNSTDPKLHLSAGTMIDGIRVRGPHVVVRIHNQVIAESDAPLFTNEQAQNLGLPANHAEPIFSENKPDQYGYVANPAGKSYKDTGVAGFLTSKDNPHPEWAKLAPQFLGTFQVPTLRNVAEGEGPNFVKAYMHNGYLKSLKEVVHFYNTRDALPHCPQGSPGEKVKCWPAPEIAQNESYLLGNLHLSSQDEDDIVAFLKTLTDGYVPR